MLEHNSNEPNFDIEPPKVAYHGACEYCYLETGGIISFLLGKKCHKCGRSI